MVDDRHVAQAERPEEDVGAVQREVERDGDAGVVDVGREVDEVVGVHRLVDVLLQELVRRQVRALLAHAVNEGGRLFRFHVLADISIGL